MGLLDINLSINRFKVKIPLYDIGTIVAGFYVGYNEGKGVDMSPTAEYITKYGPTAFMMTVTSLLIKAGKVLGVVSLNNMKEALEQENIEVTWRNRKVKLYELNDVQKKEVLPSIMENIKHTESGLQKMGYLKPTLKSGAKTALETMVGYAAGRLYSQFG